MSYASIVIEVDGPVGIVTLNRADRHNAFDEILIEDLTRGLHELEANPAVRVVVLSAVGKSFSAGADLGWMRRGLAGGEEEHRAEANRLGEAMQRLNTLSKPTVARVHGSAIGSGVGLVAACDVALATFDAQFALSEVSLGLMPAMVAPYVIARIGERYARRYLLTGERFGAAEAYRIGLVHEIVPDESSLDEAVGEIIEALLKNGPQAMAATKSLLLASAHRPVDDAVLGDCARRIVALRAAPEAREGLAAFLDKRPPDWAVGKE